VQSIIPIHQWLTLFGNYLFNSKRLFSNKQHKREVSIADVMNIEKRLMQAMDMIVIKKKRIAIAKRQSLEKINEGMGRRSGLWSMIYPTGNNRNQESNIPNIFFVHYFK
jgi:hypothetical protein